MGQLLQWKLGYPFQGALPSLVEKMKMKQPAAAEYPFSADPQDQAKEPPLCRQKLWQEAEEAPHHP